VVSPFLGYADVERIGREGFPYNKKGLANAGLTEEQSTTNLY
jgi:hypothetical protein